MGAFTTSPAAGLGAVTADKPREAAEAPQESARKGKVSTALTVAAVSIASVLGLDSLHRTWRGHEHAETWGTLSAPAFGPVAEPTRHQQQTFAQYLEAHRSHFVGRSNFFSETQRRCDELTKRLEAIERGQTTAGADEMRQLRKDIHALESSLESRNPPPYRSQDELSKSFEARHGDVEQLSRKLFELTTGKPLPKSVSFDARQLNSDRAGEVGLYSTQVSYTPGNYSKSLITNLHELGHEAYQGNESRAAGLVPFSLGVRTHEAHIMEECAAELFRLASADKIDDQELWDEVGTLEIARIEGYFSGAQDTSAHHNEASAVADAYLTLCQGNVAAAYRLISTSNTVDPAARAILERNRELYASGQTPTQLSESLMRLSQNVRQSVKGLAQRIDSLASTAVADK